MGIGQAFDSTVKYYDDWMQKALPNYCDLFKSDIEIIPFEKNRPINVLDLGAGTGLFSKHVLDSYRNAHFVLYDLGEKMLNIARERFASSPKQFEYILGDYRTLNLSQKFDLVISSLSIHHLEDDEKQKLFKEIYLLINNGGLFINIDQIRGETKEVRDLYWNHWLEQVNQSGASQEQINDSIERRLTYDKDSLLMDQLNWLKEAGFKDIDCVYKNYFVGVFMGCKNK